MIYPTRRAVTVLAAGAPVALLAGVLTPVGWLVGPVWIAGVVLLFAADALLTGSRSSLTLAPPEPVRAAVGRPGLVGLTARFAAQGRAPHQVEAALSGEAKLGVDDAPRQAGVRDHVASSPSPSRPNDAATQACMSFGYAGAARWVWPGSRRRSVWICRRRC